MKPRYKNLSILVMMAKRQNVLKSSLRQIIINIENKNSEKQEKSIISNIVQKNELK